MRTIISTTLLALLLASTVAGAADQFQERFLSNISLEVTPKGEQYVGDIIQSPVYKVRFEAFPGHSFSPSYAIIEVFDSGDDLVPVVVPSTNEDLPYFNQLVHPDFQLDTSSAADFEAMLIAVMPGDFFDDDRSDSVETSDGRWIFYTGTFFDKRKGFVIDLNESGQITGVSYSLEL